MPSYGYSDEDIARIAYTLVRELQIVHRDKVSPPWDHCARWQQESTTEGVRLVRCGATDEEVWLKAHPPMGPWDELTPAQRDRAMMFRLTVTYLYSRALHAWDGANPLEQPMATVSGGHQAGKKQRSKANPPAGARGNAS